jgi:hypothetical protein
MSMQLIPYSFSKIVEYPYTQQPETPGQTQGVYISFHPEDYKLILAKIIGWFSGRPEIDLIDTGVSNKFGLGHIILEWIEHAIDQLFLLAILWDEVVVADYTVNIRVLEEV